MIRPRPWLAEPVLSPRLTLRPGRDTDSDRAAVVQMLTDPQIRQFLGGPVPDEDAREAVNGPAGQRWGSFLLELRQGDGSATAAVIGGCSLSRERGELEVSYQLLPRFWGQGFATEAVAAILAWAHEHLHDSGVIAVTQAANSASLGLLARLGFVARERFVEFGADQVLLHRELGAERPATG